MKFWLLGTEKDKHVGDEILASSGSSGVVNLMGLTDLPELMELLKISNLLFTNDSGPMHFAAALGIPTISLFGPTDPDKTGPFGKNHKVFQSQEKCSPCFQKKCPLERQLCLFDVINSSVVADFILKIINQSK